MGAVQQKLIKGVHNSLIHHKMRFTSCMGYLAQCLEDHGRSSNFFHYLLSHMLVNIACGPIRVLCWNPLMAILAAVLLYIVFLIVFVPLWLISFIVSSWGSLVIFTVLLHLLSVHVTQSIAFAGSSAMAQKQISGDIIGRISTFLENVAISTHEHASTLMLISIEQLPSAESSNCMSQLNQLWQSVQFLPNIHHYMSEAVDQVKAFGVVSPEDAKVLSQLCSVLPEFYQVFQLLITGISQNRLVPNNRNLLSLLGKIVKSSEIMRIAAVSMRPLKTDEDSNSGTLTTILNVASSFRSPLSSFEHLSFPYMRSILQKKYSAKLHFVEVSKGCNIDCAFFPAQSQNKRGLVFFCSPNAAFYECISQVDLSKSWFGFYRSHGFDIFMFNYRGYGRSNGAPSPSVVKMDAELLLDHVKQLYNPTFVLAHGESIGGMVASHLARKKQIDALVCDRTFASLDAAASRLMGNWAGCSMRWLSWWRTDVVADYLAVACPKLIFQDPNDEIIAEAASLRSGIAKYFALNETIWQVNEELIAYQRARFKDLTLSNFTRSTDTILSTVKLGFLSEELISHFYFCCIALLRFCKEDSKSFNSADDDSLKNNVKGENHGIRKKMWSVISNVQAEHGHKLGASVARGYDSFRSWLCSFCVWQQELVLEANRSNLDSSLEILSSLNINEGDTCSNHIFMCYQFVMLCLRLIVAKRSEIFLPKLVHSVGKLIPVHCGHNGWLTEVELKCYESWLDGMMSSNTA